MITFHNAKDMDDRIVHINDVTKENKSNHYYCIGCGGEMSAVLGNKREHHFRHKEAHCSWESYLHKLGKLRLKQLFDTQESFKIKYIAKYHCEKADDCKLPYVNKCNIFDFNEVDLKRYYDTCEEEVTYKGFRADLMLSSKEHPERKPIFLEISVTHDCEPQKRASGIRIIELKITNENDAWRPLKEDYHFLKRELEEQHPYQERNLPPIRFYNFKRYLEKLTPLDRFWIEKDKDGILRDYVEKGNLSCRDIDTNHKEHSIYEITAPSEEIIKNKVLDFSFFGFLKANWAGVKIKHCQFCMVYPRCILELKQKIDDNHFEKKQILNRNIPDKNIDKVLLANSCNNYAYDFIHFDKMLKSMKRGFTHWEWKREN